LPHPLGATWDGGGVDFALFYAHATRVEICLFDGQGERETARVELREYADEIWQGYLRRVARGAIRRCRPTPRHASSCVDPEHVFEPEFLVVEEIGFSSPPTR
jgi:isoamylase